MCRHVWLWRHVWVWRLIWVRRHVLDVKVIRLNGIFVEPHIFVHVFRIISISIDFDLVKFSTWIQTSLISSFINKNIDLSAILKKVLRMFIYIRHQFWSKLNDYESERQQLWKILFRYKKLFFRQKVWKWWNAFNMFVDTQSTETNREKSVENEIWFLLNIKTYFK